MAGGRWRGRHRGAEIGFDLPNIALGAHTTLAYSQNATGAGGTLTVSDGRHATAIALLGNYMAGSFVAVADGHGGTLINEGQTEQLLAGASTSVTMSAIGI